MLSRLQVAPTARKADTKRRAPSNWENSPPTSDPAPGLTSENHDLEYPYTFIYSFSCLHLPAFMSHATTVSEKSTLFTFSYTKPTLQNLTLPYNRSRSTQGHHFNKLWWNGVPDATYQILWKSVHWFRRSF